MMILRYQTGEEITKGDRVLFHGEPGRIELVAVELTGDPETDWHMQEHGGGVMILEDVLGRTFIPADQICECEDWNSYPGPLLLRKFRLGWIRLKRVRQPPWT